MIYYQDLSGIWDLTKRFPWPNRCHLLNSLGASGVGGHPAVQLWAPWQGQFFHASATSSLPSSMEVEMFHPAWERTASLPHREAKGEETVPVLQAHDASELLRCSAQWWDKLVLWWMCGCWGYRVRNQKMGGE